MQPNTEQVLVTFGWHPVNLLHVHPFLQVRMPGLFKESVLTAPEAAKGPSNWNLQVMCNNVPLWPVITITIEIEILRTCLLQKCVLAINAYSCFVVYQCHCAHSQFSYSPSSAHNGSRRCRLRLPMLGAHSHDFKATAKQDVQQLRQACHKNCAGVWVSKLSFTCVPTCRCCYNVKHSLKIVYKKHFFKVGRSLPYPWTCRFLNS